jgi:hypothetical protein
LALLLHINYFHQAKNQALQKAVENLELKAEIRALKDQVSS